jgi:hypothetical protein
MSEELQKLQTEWRRIDGNEMPEDIAEQPIDIVRKAAGFVRNTKIAEECDVLIAVVASDRLGGTEDTIRKAEKLGKQIILVE